MGPSCRTTLGVPVQNRDGRGDRERAGRIIPIKVRNNIDDGQRKPCIQQLAGHACVHVDQPVMEQRGILVLKFVDNVCEVLALTAGIEDEAAAIEAGAYVRTQSDTVGDVVDTRCRAEDMLIHVTGIKPVFLGPRHEISTFKGWERTDGW